MRQNTDEYNKYFYIGLLFVCIGLIAQLILMSLTQYLVVITIILFVIFILWKSNIGLDFTFSLFFLSMMHLLKIFKFDYFPQVKILLGNNPFTLIKKGHPHGYRFLVSYPAVIISNVCKINIDEAYTIYCIIAFSIMAALMLKVINSIDKPNKQLINIFRLISILMQITIISHFMNGRLVLAYTGLTIIINVFTDLFGKTSRLSILKVVEVAIAILLTTVSSGTMMVALCLVVISMLSYSIKNKKYKEMGVAVIVCIPFIIKFSKYVFQMIMKNVNFFGGGIKGVLEMTRHGIGFMTLIKGLALLVMCIYMIIFIKYIIDIYRENIMLTTVAISVPIALCCGIFGKSTATMMIPGCIMLSTLIMTCKKIYAIRGSEYVQKNT